MSQFKHNDKMIYSVPKQLGDSNYYTQMISDEENKKHYIAVLSKRSDGTFVKQGFPDFMRDNNHTAKVLMERTKRQREF
jgi:hypothetical protein